MPPKKRFSIGKKSDDARRVAKARAAETAEQRLNRLQKGRRLAAIRIQNETPEERALRLQKARERIAAKRKLLRDAERRNNRVKIITAFHVKKSKRTNMRSQEHHGMEHSNPFSVNHSHKNRFAHSYLSFSNDSQGKNPLSFCPTLDLDVLKCFVEESADAMDESITGGLKLELDTDNNEDCLSLIELDVDAPQLEVYADLTEQ